MFKISFDFDEITQTVHNLSCEKIDHSIQIYPNGKPTVEVGENKLIISPEAQQLLKTSAGDRISINYIQKSNELTIPVIGKSELFADREAGNKLTKSSTVSFKGQQRTILLEYGSVFELKESNRKNMFQLVPISEDETLMLEKDDEMTEEDFNKFDELDQLPF